MRIYFLLIDSYLLKKKSRSMNKYYLKVKFPNDLSIYFSKNIIISLWRREIKKLPNHTDLKQI